MKAVDLALASFAHYEDKEEERISFLRQHFEAHPYLKTLLGSTVKELIDVKEQLLEKENKLFQQYMLSKVNLEKFLLEPMKSMKATDHVLFPPDGVGNHLLLRRNVVERVMQEISSQHRMHRNYPPSIYLSGWRGLGKTTCLKLIGMELKNKGYEVYYFDYPSRIPRDAGDEFLSMAKEGRNVAVLIDGADRTKDSTIFLDLVECSTPNVVTIAAATPLFAPMTLSCNFRKCIRTPDLLLKESDEDFQDLVKYWEDTQAATREMTNFICKYLLAYCGGHVFPMLAFMEYFFTSNYEMRSELELESRKKAMESENEFKKYLGSAVLSGSSFYEILTDRCFPLPKDHETLDVVARVARRQQVAGDIKFLAQLGWWQAGCQFISPLLVDVCINNVCPSWHLPAKCLRMPEEEEDIEAVKYENAELAIVEGLSGMVEADFRCDYDSLRQEVPVIDGVAFSWANGVKWRIANAHLSFLLRGKNSGRVGCYLHGHADCAVGILVRTPLPTLSEDVDSHFDQYASGNHPWKRFVLLNFDLTKEAKDEVILPKDMKCSGTDVHNRVYTYVHSTNTLYRGKVAIKAPVIPSLPRPKPFKTMEQTRKCSTLARTGFESHGVSLSLKRFLRFL